MSSPILPPEPEVGYKPVRLENYNLDILWRLDNIIANMESGGSSSTPPTLPPSATTLSFPIVNKWGDQVWLPIVQNVSFVNFTPDVPGTEVFQSYAKVTYLDNVNSPSNYIPLDVDNLLALSNEGLEFTIVISNLKSANIMAGFYPYSYSNILEVVGDIENETITIEPGKTKEISFLPILDDNLNVVKIRGIVG